MLTLSAKTAIPRLSGELFLISTGIPKARRATVGAIAKTAALNVGELSLFAFNPEDVAINKALTQDQIEFVKANAPVFIAPNCADNPNLDAFCEINFDGDWLAGNNLNNMAKASSSTPTIYYDWYETTGFIVISYMQYRPKNEVPGITMGFGNHAHDTESVVLVFKKSGEYQDSAVVGVSETQPELRAVLANAHGIFVSAAPIKDFVSQLNQDHTSIAFSGWGMADENMRKITHDGSKPEDRVFDYVVEARKSAFIYSKPKNHSLVPVMKLALAEELLDDESTWVFQRSSQQKTDRFARTTRKTYELVEFSSIVNDSTPIASSNPQENGRTKTECLFVPNTPIAKAKYKSWNGQDVCINQNVNRDLQEKLNGEGAQPVAYSHAVTNYKKVSGARRLNDIKP